MADWIQVTLEAKPGASEHLSRLLVELGAGGVEERPAGGEDWPVSQPWDPPSTFQPDRLELVAWLPADSKPAVLQRLRAEGIEPRFEQVNSEDWEENWKKLHHAVQISNGLRVSPPWEAQEGDLVIPPGLAFGTGEHPATRACLEAIEKLAPECSRCLDIGCGSGVLSLAAARHGLQGYGIDIDPDAVAESRSNAAINTLDARFSSQPLSEIEGGWDLVVANLYAEVICTLSSDIARVSANHLVLAGVLADRWETVLHALSPPLTLRETITDGDWVCLHLERS